MKYYNNERLDVLEVRASGVLNADDIKNHYLSLSNYKSQNQPVKTLVDFKETTLKLKPHEIASSLENAEQEIGRYAKFKEAIVVNEPYETALVILWGQVLSKAHNYMFKVFSTEKAAYHWLAS
jgi:hypothetical protein